MSPPTAQPPASWQGPVRIAIAVLVAGFLVVWLVKPIGNPCPDLDRLPQGSSASSSPSFSPPGARTCTYTAAGGIRAESKYMPWLDWIVLLLLAAVAAAAVRVLSPVSGGGGARAPRGEREPRGERAPSLDRAPRADPSPPPPPTEPAHSPASSGERDAAERERARRERAERAARRGR
jgi:hypothetical protein